MIGSLFTRTCCLALTWDADRRCRGLRLRRAGDTYTVEKNWQAQAAEGQTLGACLSEGIRALGADETCSIAVGPTACVTGLTDLQMPRLAPLDLRKALAFELKRQVPVVSDHLVWGYRVLPGGNGPQKHPVRIAYFRGSDWGKLLDELGGIVPGIDHLLPPAAAVDPVLAERALFVAGLQGTGFLLAPTANGAREITPTAAPPDGAFGAGPTPLAMDKVTLGPDLSAAPAERQSEFAGALLLGLYALGRTAATDAATWLPIPRELRIRRNRAGRLAAVVLAAYFLLGLGTYIGLRTYEAHRYYQALRVQAAGLSRQIAALRTGKNDHEFLGKLQAEFKDATFGRPGFAACLLEITQLIGTDAWVQGLSWNDSKLEIELSTTNEKLDILPRLEASPLLAEVVPLRVTTDATTNTSTRRLQMTASFDPTQLGMAPPPAPVSPLPPPPPPMPPSLTPPAGTVPANHVPAAPADEKEE